jgi:hypothetical protein
LAVDAAGDGDGDDFTFFFDVAGDLPAALRFVDMIAAVDVGDVEQRLISA